MNPYTQLGIPPSASPDDVDRAYKRRARDAHPDRNGGDNEQFLAVQKAYDLLKDAELRRNFDATGEWGERKPDKRLERPMQKVQQVFVAVLKRLTELHEEPKHHNLVEMMQQVLDNSIAQHEQQRSLITDILESFRDCRDRFTTKAVGEDGENDNIMAGLIAHQIATTERELQGCEVEIEACRQAKRIVQDYKFKHRAKRAATMSATGAATTSAATGWATFG